MTFSHTTTIEGTQIDVAPLETIDFSGLVNKDPVEVAKLLKSCQTPGFFYLDLQNDTARQILAALQDVVDVTERYFDQPHELKMKDYSESEMWGYKPGMDEYFEIAHDTIAQKALVLPSILQDRVQLIEHFGELSHCIVHTMLSCLSDALGLDGSGRFEKNHREGKRSNTALKLIYEPTQPELADVVENKHTDMGTLTLLFGDKWGLEMEFPETKTWGFIQPKAGHAVVNVADSLHLLSGKRLHSCVHRVAQPVRGFQKRYYIVYLLRPEIGIKFDN